MVAVALTAPPLFPGETENERLVPRFQFKTVFGTFLSAVFFYFYFYFLYYMDYIFFRNVVAKLVDKISTVPLYYYFIK